MCALYRDVHAAMAIAGVCDTPLHDAVHRYSRRAYAIRPYTTLFDMVRYLKLRSAALRHRHGFHQRRVDLQQRRADPAGQIAWVDDPIPARVGGLGQQAYRLPGVDLVEHLA